MDKNKTLHIHTDNVLGIDVGIKKIAICSDGEKYSNINNTERVKKIEKKLKREKRSLNRMMQSNIIGYNGRVPIFRLSLDKCKNFQKQKRKVHLLYRRLKNIRNDYLQKVSSDIINKCPKEIVMEDLHVRSMMNNRFISAKLANAKLRYLIDLIGYKAKLNGIEFIKADRFFLLLSVALAVDTSRKI